MYKIISINKENENQIITPPPLSVYIHIPWCVKKCPYCDFNSHRINSKIDEEQYINNIIKDLEYTLPIIWGRNIISIYIGGGTPSLFHPKNIDTMLSKIRSLVNVVPEAEISMELNPGTIEYHNLKDYKDAGINRLSIGIQSFNDKLLKNIGRIHTAQNAIFAVESARKIFDNINIDLMYALPGQSINDTIKDIEKAINLNPNHLSVYQLTIEENTIFAKKTPKFLPNNDNIAHIEDIIYPILEDAQYKRYEISAFSKKNYQCKHNLNYWSYGDYLGLGAGSHGKITIENQIIRTIKENSPIKYHQDILNNKTNAKNYNVNLKDIPFEFFLNAFRLINGFDIDLYNLRTGLNIISIQNILNLAKQKKLIDLDNKNIKPSKLGVRYLNDLLELFLPD